MAQLENSQAPRFVFLDCMRGVAVLMVMLTHFAEGRIEVIDQINSTHIQIGQAGVSIFFLISGYIIPKSISSSISLRVFWLHRFFRLFPIYWCSILLALVLTRCGLMRLPAEINAREVILNLSMLQGFLRAPDVIGVFWSLKFEMAFYILMTALALAGLMRYYFSICLAYSAGIVIVAAWMFCIQGRYFAYGLFYIQLMLIGWVVSSAEACTNRRQSTIAVGIGLVVAALAAFTSFYGRVDLTGAGTLTLTPMFFAWLVGVAAFQLAVHFRHSVYWPSWLAWVGKVSYSCYLLHVLVLFVMTPVIPYFGPLAIPGLLAVSLILAWIGHRFVELPSIAFGKRVANNWIPMKPAIAAGASK